MSSFIGLNAPLGFAGTVSRGPAYDATIETKVCKKAVKYGQLVKLEADGTVAPVASNSDATKVYGVVVREFHQEGADTQKMVSVLRRGYIFVEVNKGAPEVGKAVHLGSDGLFAKSGGTDVPNTLVMGTDGATAEIAFNI